MRFALFVLVAVLVLGACTSTQIPPLEERVPNASGEVLYTDVLSEGLVADEMVFFGVRLGDSLTTVTSLHGPPDINDSYKFGQVQNYEYFFGQDAAAVLYHAERGVITSVLVTRDAAPLLVGETQMNLSLADVYGLLGTPTLSVDRPGERVFLYDELGYEVYLQDRAVDRIYFTSPNRGIQSPGTPSNATLPENVSGEPRNSAPVICIQVVTPAVSPDGVCVEYPTPCDVPSGWTRVESCP